MNTPRDAITIETFRTFPITLQVALITMAIIIAALVTIAIREERHHP